MLIPARSLATCDGLVFKFLLALAAPMLARPASEYRPFIEEAACPPLGVCAGPLTLLYRLFIEAQPLMFGANYGNGSLKIIFIRFLAQRIPASAEYFPPIFPYCPFAYSEEQVSHHGARQVRCMVKALPPSNEPNHVNAHHNWHGLVQREGMEWQEYQGNIDIRDICSASC
jgi:hypothetical protein